MIKSICIGLLLMIASIGSSQSLEQQVIIDGLSASYYCKTKQYSELDTYLNDRGYEQEHKPNTKRVYIKQGENGEQIMLLILGYEWVEVTSDANGFKEGVDKSLLTDPFIKKEVSHYLVLPNTEDPGYETIITWEGENKAYLTFSPPEIHNETKSWDLYFEEIFE